MATLTRYDHFYDAQVRRYLTQMVRAFSGFQYTAGSKNGTQQLLPVPCIPASRDRQVAAIRRNMSENTVLSVPLITVYITAFEPSRERMQNLNHVDTSHIAERERDPQTGKYTDRIGTLATVEKLMPRPFDITFQIDIWTSNMDQKFQLLEQIDMLIFPGFDIQNSDNALDWSALTTAEFVSQTFSSITIPVGTETDIDVASITMKVPMWLQPPARVTRQRLIKQVVTNIAQADVDQNGDLYNTGELMQRIITTPTGYGISVEGNQITILGKNGITHDGDGDPILWNDMFAHHSINFDAGVTKLTLRQSTGDDTADDISGLIYATGDPAVMHWQPDISSLPANTLPALSGIVDPARSFPSVGNLPAAADGQRYLIVNDLAGPSQAWGALTAREGSIIEYVNNVWTISFDSSYAHNTEYVLNSSTGRQLVWNPSASKWTMAIDGTYHEGYWRIM